MPSQFSETAPGGTVSGTRTVRRQSRGLIVEYALEWTGDGSVTIRLADRIPTADVQEYGFHEDHAPSEWSVTDGELDLEADVGAGSERRLVLGLIADDVAADALDGEGPVVDVVGRDGDADHAAADGPDVDLDDDLEDTGAEPEGWGQTDAGPASGDGPEGRRVDADGGVVNRGPDSEDTVAARLIAELEAGDVTGSELSTLREHLDDGAESDAIRLEYVQKRLSDFDAYVDALEDLISVHGSGDDAITDLDERLDDLADEVATVRQRQDEMADRLDALSRSLDDHAAALESHLVTHEADVDDLRTEIRRRSEVMCEEFNDLQQSLDEDLAALETEIEAFESIRRTLVDGLQRPDDFPAGTTVEDADPSALEGTEEIPIVDPGETGDHRDGPDDSVDTDDPDDATVELETAADDPALESRAPSDGTDGNDDTGGVTDAAVDRPEVSVDLEESLERAEASNYSDSTDSPEDDADRAESVKERDDDGRFDDEFVRPASDGSGDVTEKGEGSGDMSGEGDGGSPDAPDVDGEDAGDEAGEEFVVPGPDVDEVDSSEDTEIDDTTQNGGPDADANPDDGDPDDGDDGDTEDDEADGRASSIFEIGDVGTNESGDEEKPTIDFEDT